MADGERTGEADWLADWAVIWRSELRALAEDQEVREAEEALGDALRRAWAAPPPRPAPAAVPPEPGGTAGTLARLERRLAELERRLASLDAAQG